MILALEEEDPAKAVPERQPPARLSPLETEIIDFFVQLSRLLGQPRSLAELYGLLFISGHPLAMDDLIERLQLSKGSASQGLKFLRNIGAVRMVYVAGERRVYYEAVAELRNLATRFLRDQIVAHLDGSLGRIDRLAAMVQDLPPAERDQVRARVAMLQSWEKRTRKILPIALKILGA
jgi:DNA-binding transcriptional regulator GbsR (MarR family)